MVVLMLLGLLMVLMQAPSMADEAVCVNVLNTHCLNLEIIVAPGPDSLMSARDAMRKLRLGCGAVSPAIVRLASGIHTVMSPLVLDKRDRNTQWIGDQGTIVSGGVAVTGWRSIGDTSVIAASLPWPLQNPPRQLYVDGMKANWTRDSPNASIAGLQACSTSPLENMMEESFVSNATVLSDAGLLTPSTAPLSWPDPTNVELIHESAYPESRCRVDSVRKLNSGMVEVKIVQPCWSFGRVLGQMGCPSAILNIGGANHLQAGQWSSVMNQTTRILLYNPKSTMERHGLLNGIIESVVPVKESLISIVDTEAISLSGTTYMYSAWNAPSNIDGYLERYSGIRYLPCNSSEVKDSPSSCFKGDEGCSAGCCGTVASYDGCALKTSEAAVQILGSTRISVVNCTFTATGGWGLSVSKGSTKIEIGWNHIYNTSGGGMYLGNVNETRSNMSVTYPSELLVHDNVVEWTGLDYRGTSGIHLFAAVDSAIVHNRVAHIPYTAITFVWPVPQEDSFNRNLSLIANDVEDPSYWGGDGGAIHTLAWCIDCIIDRNYFHDQRHGTKTTYIDNGSSGYNLTNHVVVNAPVSLWLYYQQACRPSCPFIPGEHPYPGCNYTDHSKCCCNAGADNHATNCWIQNSLPDPFPVQNISNRNFIDGGKPLPPRAQAIVDAAGPRPVYLQPFSFSQ